MTPDLGLGIVTAKELESTIPHERRVRLEIAATMHDLAHQKRCRAAEYRRAAELLEAEALKCDEAERLHLGEGVK